MLTPTATMRTSVSGTYQRRQGDRRVYTYTGAYGVNSEGTWWLVSVRCDGKLKGTPMGVLEKERAPRYLPICRLIERQIEDLDQLAE